MLQHCNIITFTSAASCQGSPSKCNHGACFLAWFRSWLKCSNGLPTGGTYFCGAAHLSGSGKQYDLASQAQEHCFLLIAQCSAIRVTHCLVCRYPHPTPPPAGYR
ncbi:hypothetical protein CY34DRAFT_694979 [Suillus luteus UH-Slu-Lm8-n1]|uniref:Uncharacterized protein n=1 Tax=Suillus luteus UH-Slu-Lm8-n1 TaxID=930992 RepID=A0A0D0AP74_9AGAM|nr:hypothetical protein CY34DRAFT_694979 [Suillus luteus UH-Slu-Lm8-n1]